MSACAQAGAAAAVAAGRPRLGSALFCLALNHKQMVLYFAPAFFAHLLGCALRLPGPAAKARRPARGPPAVGARPVRTQGGVMRMLHEHAGDALCNARAC